MVSASQVGLSCELSITQSGCSFCHPVVAGLGKRAVTKPVGEVAARPMRTAQRELKGRAMWTALIICTTLVLLAVLSLCAWLPFLKWGIDVLRELGGDELASLAGYLRSWPHPLSWVAKAVPRHRSVDVDGNNLGEAKGAADSEPEPADDIDDVA